MVLFLHFQYIQLHFYELHFNVVEYHTYKAFDHQNGATKRSLTTMDHPRVVHLEKQATGSIIPESPPSNQCGNRHKLLGFSSAATPLGTCPGLL